MKATVGTLAACLMALHTNQAAAEADASAIFASLEPSLVAVTNAEGGGSGVVLSESGLILTNFHVANTPLPLSVEAFVSEGGRTVKKVFANVKLTKVHKTSDLALLQVDAKDVRFKPARISKSERDTVAGGNCFALGYPYVPGQDKPVLSITKGIISSAKRIVGNEPYIQVDAAINPGNSGGALANDKGVVIGIPTLKFEGADRIGLAAPLSGLSMNQFIDVKERKGHPAEAERLSTMAMNLVLHDALSFGTDPEVLELAVFLQREAIALEPNNPQWTLNISGMYMRLGNFPIAMAYAKSAVEKDPDNIGARALLADCQDQLGQAEEAIANRFACLGIPADGKDAERRAEVMAKLASGYSARNEMARALYVISWLRSLSTEPPGADERLALQKAGDVLPAEWVSSIMAKKSGHSVPDMEAQVKLAPEPKRTANRDPVAPADPTKLEPQGARSEKVTSELKVKPGSKAELVDSPPGVQYDGASGSLVWTPPPFSKTATIDVLFLITHPDGTEETLVHTIGAK